MGKLGKVSWIVPRRAIDDKVSGLREDISLFIFKNKSERAISRYSPTDFNLYK